MHTVCSLLPFSGFTIGSPFQSQGPNLWISLRCLTKICTWLERVRLLVSFFGKCIACRKNWGRGLWNDAEGHKMWIANGMTEISQRNVWIGLNSILWRTNIVGLFLNSKYSSKMSERTKHWGMQTLSLGLAKYIWDWKVKVCTEPGGHKIHNRNKWLPGLQGSLYSFKIGIHIY